MPVAHTLSRQVFLHPSRSSDLTYKVTVKLGRPAISEISCFSAVDKGMLTFSLPLTTNLTTTQYYHSFSFVDRRPAPKTPPSTRLRSPLSSCSSSSSTSSRLNAGTAAAEAAAATHPSRVVPVKPDTSSNRRPSRMSHSNVPPSPSPLSLRSSTDAKSYLKPTKASSLKAPPIRVNI